MPRRFFPWPKGTIVTPALRSQAARNSRAPAACTPRPAGHTPNDAIRAYQPSVVADATFEYVESPAAFVARTR